MKQRVSSFCAAAFTAFSRTKAVDIERIHDTELKRCLGVVDLIALGVGNTLGMGMYVLAGQITKTVTGPAIILSFTIAALATLLSALCYAEFATRIPRAGSAYVYSYVSVGELLAFIIGWNMLLENVIGAAATGKACSQYFDSLLNDTISKWVVHNVGSMDLPAGFEQYPDFLAMALLLLGTLFISIGVKISTTLNMILTVITMGMVVFIFIVGLFYVHITNWTESPGGFFPFGLHGVVKGAASCFFAYIGFDTIATSGEESSKPTKHVPIAIVSTLIICLLSYVDVSAIMTLLVPWNTLSGSAALPKAFAQAGAPWAMTVIAIGGLCGLIASMLGSIFPLPRAVYAMAQDGIVYRFLGIVNSKTNTPFIATWVCGITVVLWALFFDLAALVQMMSIGTLMAYTLVAISVLALHYQREQVGLLASDHSPGIESIDVTPSTSQDPSRDASPQLERKSVGVPTANGTKPTLTEDTGLLKVSDTSKPAHYDEQLEKPQLDSTEAGDGGYSNKARTIRRLFNMGENVATRPTGRTKRIVMVSLLLVVVFWAALSLLIVQGCSQGLCDTWWAIILIIFFVVCTVTCIALLTRQPRNGHLLHFQVPLVPWTPLASILVNILLMVALSQSTWIRFVVWLTIGMIIYLSYGVWHSNERRLNKTTPVIMYDVSDKDMIIDDASR